MRRKTAAPTAADAILVVDEAHATGVFGPGGAGLAHGLARRDNLVTLHTCGKALGAEGALLCGPAIACDFLVNRGRPFIFSTAPSPLMAWLVRQAIEIVANEPERQERLHGLVRHAAERLVPLGIPASGTQILPVIIGDNDRTMRIAGSLQGAGFDWTGSYHAAFINGIAWNLLNLGICVFLLTRVRRLGLRFGAMGAA